MEKHILSGQLWGVVVHGIDVVEIEDFRRMLHTELSGQLSMTFTEQELKECGRNERTAERLAGRFATKEAVLKALGLGFGDGVAFTDVETLNEVTGAPRLLLHRLVALHAKEHSVDEWLVSTSHSSSIAMASVIGVRRLPV